MTNDNKPTLRVVPTETDEHTKELLAYLRTAVEHVEKGQTLGIMISMVQTDGAIVNMVSSSNERHKLVAASVYQLFDIVMSEMDIVSK